MPRYRYECIHCKDICMVFHLMNEDYTDCEKCGTENSMQKKLTTPLKFSKLKEEVKDIGAITKEYIVANKEILEEEKQKVKSETYEPS